MIPYLIVLSLILLFFLAVVARGECIPKEIKARDTQIDLWKEQFPNTSEVDIKKFLLIVVDDFLFSHKAIWLLSPEDTVKELYDFAIGPNAIYDDLEIESFALSLDEAYDIKLEDILNVKLSLADIFSLTQMKL